jgi:hypothetical protein
VSEVTNVDLAHNVTIIPNPDKPIEHAGVLVKWHYYGSNVNYAVGETATAYLQLWRYVGEIGSQTELKLVGQTHITIDSVGDRTVVLSDDERLYAEKGDLIGMTMEGAGSLVFYNGTSDIHCTLVGDERPVYHSVDSSSNFSSVWLDDWTYDIAAEFLPEQSGN